MPTVTDKSVVSLSGKLYLCLLVTRWNHCCSLIISCLVVIYCNYTLYTPNDPEREPFLTCQGLQTWT